MTDDLAKAKAAVLDLDADTIIAAIRQLADKKDHAGIYRVFWAAADAEGITPIISLYPRYEIEDWNECEQENPARQITLAMAREAAETIASYDHHYARDGIRSDWHAEVERLIEQRAELERNANPLTPATP